MADNERDPVLPREPIHRLTDPMTRFLHVEATSGILLLICTAIALILANSAAADWYQEIWKIRVGFSWGDFSMVHSLQHWINDGLMAIFFFVVGLEVKREMVIGELRDPKRAALPVAAAIGGMVIPAGVYLLMQGGVPVTSIESLIADAKMRSRTSGLDQSESATCRSTPRSVRPPVAVITSFSTASIGWGIPSSWSRGSPRSPATTRMSP